MPSDASTGLRLSSLHAAAFLGIGIYLSFFPVWLQSKGMSAATIGVVLAIPIVVRILATAPLLALADRRLGPRPLLLACHGAQLAGYPVMFFLDNQILIAGMVALLSVAQAAVIPGNDLVTTNAIRDGARLNYGRVRVWGSMSFLAASIAAGYLIDAFGPGVILWGLALTPLAGILATALALPTGRASGCGPAKAPESASRAPIPRILWVVMMGAGLIQATHAVIYAFGSIHWRGIGFTDTAIGYLWAIGVVAEIGVFVFLGRAVGHGSIGLGLIVVGAGAAVFRFAAMAFEPSLAATFALQALHGLSFGATHLGAMAALAALSPIEARGRAQGLYGSTIALVMAGATIASGPLYRAFGGDAFAAMAPLGLLGLVLVLWAGRVVKRRPDAAQPQSSGFGG